MKNNKLLTIFLPYLHYFRPYINRYELVLTEQFYMQSSFNLSHLRPIVTRVTEL